MSSFFNKPLQFLSTSVDVVKADILVVDDTPANLEMLLNFLGQQHYRARVTTRGKLVLKSVKLAPPDLILLDINMPEMNGYEVCQQLKSDPQFEKIPVIFISALEEVFDKVKAFAVGGVDYITKPFQFEEVLARIEHQLKFSRLQKEMEQKNILLEKKNQELEKKNQELIQSYKKAYLLFSALSETLSDYILNDQYCLEKKIGQGGNGVVYKALDLKTNTYVAIKVFQPNSGKVTPDIIQRYKIEGISASKVNHPNAISVLDFHIAEECLPYLVMELLTGRTLKEELVHVGQMSIERSKEIIIPVCNVLIEAHQAGIIHRDIKPENIFLHQANNQEIVKVLDFGVAKILPEDSSLDIQNLLTITGKILGSPAFLAPERLRNLPYDGRVDVYSLGVMLYTMLSGKLPFNTNNNDIWALVNMHLYQQPQPLQELVPNISPSVENLLMQALSKDPGQRPTAKEFMKAFLSATEASL